MKEAIAILSVIAVLAGVILVLARCDTTESERFSAEVDKFIEEAENSRFTYQTQDNGWIFFYEPNQYNSLYEGVHCITDETSAQYEWLHLHHWKFNADGIAEYNDRILVALTPEFGEIGDKVDLMFEDGSILETIIVDYKWNGERYGHRHGDDLNIIEILVSEKWYQEGFENKLYENVIAYKNEGEI